MEANWTQSPVEWTCITCGTATLDAGFVDLVGDAVMWNRDGLEPISVEARICLCANCVKMAANRVGCASPQEVDELTRANFEKDEEISRLNKEIEGWQQRFVGMVNLTADDFDRLATAFASSGGAAAGPDGAAEVTHP